MALIFVIEFESVARITAERVGIRCELVHFIVMDAIEAIRIRSVAYRFGSVSTIK